MSVIESHSPQDPSDVVTSVAATDAPAVAEVFRTAHTAAQAWRRAPAVERAALLTQARRCRASHLGVHRRPRPRPGPRRPPGHRHDPRQPTHVRRRLPRPFGGEKESSFGREQGKHARGIYTSSHTIGIAPTEG